jgi:hypothetical protein
MKYELGFCIPEDDTLHTHRHENLKFLNLVRYFFPFSPFLYSALFFLGLPRSFQNSLRLIFLTLFFLISSHFSPLFPILPFSLIVSFRTFPEATPV